MRSSSPLWGHRGQDLAVADALTVARPEAALKLTPGAFDAVNGGHPTFPFIATPPGQGAAARHAFNQAQSATYGYIYRTQPAVRKVVDFIARNAAQIGVKLYERVDDDDRKEAYDHPAAYSLRRPNPRTSGRRFLYGLIADHLIYENAYAVKLRPKRGENILFMRIPVWAMEVNVPPSGVPAFFRVHFKDGTFRDFDPDDVLHLSGYDPDDPGAGLSRLETLRMILTEESTNQAANVERLKNGGLGPGYISRPAEVPDWSDEARERFEVDWSNRASGKRDGKRVDPVLEEGMEFHESSVTPKDAEMLRSRLFTRAEVASIYGVPAELLDASDDVRGDRKEARTQFYADCLPPILGPIAEDLDVQVLEVEYGTDDHYFEFNLAEKLRGQIEERFKVLVSAAGAPILTRNEARRRENLPEVEGGDDLITPMNVTVGGKPSPGVMPPQDPNGPSQDGDERTDATERENALRAVEAQRAQAELLARREAQAARRDRYASEHKTLLRDFFTRQEKTVKSSKKFDVERWNAELADDLEAKAISTVEREGGIAAERLGMSGGFDIDSCRNYLRRGAEEKAQAINATTEKAWREQEADETDAAIAATEKQDAFEHAKGDRAEEGGLAIATGLAAFSHFEAAKQSPDAPQRLKSWVVMSGNSRHPQMGGETVPVFTPFSNGGEYPGDPKLGVDQVARCQCLLEVS